MTTRSIRLPCTQRLGLACVALAAALCLGTAAPARAAEPAWVTASNAHTRRLLEAQGAFTPEFAANQGLPQFDGKTLDLGPGVVARGIAAWENMAKTLRQRLAAERDPNVRQDLQILLGRTEHDLAGSRLNARLMLNWTDAPHAVFDGISSLLDDQVPAARRAKALELLQRYTGLAPGSTALTALARARFEESRQAHRAGPVKAQVEQAIANVPTYAGGIRALFDKFKITGPAADAALAAMDSQFNAYAAWQQRAVLPLARSDFRMPPALYAHALREAGIDIAPEVLIQRAQSSYLEVRAAMEALAPQVVQARGLQPGDYRSVIRQLKRDTIPDDRLVAHYTDINSKLEAIIRRERIVTLPERPMGMRLASAAESAAQPAPHMQAPPLVSNTGQRGSFVLPVSTPTAAPGEAYDDFNFPAVTWTLSAHEGRPGHELQFSAMVERGVSLARALYAFNSVNAEGWALYAEAEAMPHEPLEGQLLALQMRLLRAGRAMLDPMLNLGLISIDDARRLLTDEVLLSPGMARQEIERYTFRMPGQAGAYFYGYQRILQLRTETELALGKRFDRLAFNDFLLDQGMLPPDLLAQAVREKFVPGRKVGN